MSFRFRYYIHPILFTIPVFLHTYSLLFQEKHTHTIVCLLEMFMFVWYSSQYQIFFFVYVILEKDLTAIHIKFILAYFAFKVLLFVFFFFVFFGILW